MSSTVSRGGRGAAEAQWTAAAPACLDPCQQHANTLRCRQHLASCHVPKNTQCAGGWGTLALIFSMQISTSNS